MAVAEHEAYAQQLLSSMASGTIPSEPMRFVPSRSKSRNAAKAMAGILCSRIEESSGQSPVRITASTFQWKGGTFNSRNIADRSDFWTNVRRSLAEQVHTYATVGPAAYLLACCSPESEWLYAWAVPEPLLYEILGLLTPKSSAREGDPEYTIELSRRDSRIAKLVESPDLKQYFRALRLTDQEKITLENARDADRAAKERKRSVEEATTALVKGGDFDPANLVDARRRIFASVVRRQGQPAFRQKLLKSYNRRCAISGCKVEEVLECAHIIPYRGVETNHTSNGLLLRADLHTLFDLKLIAIDERMRVVVDERLRRGDYGKFHGQVLRVPTDADSRPSIEALRQHRQAGAL